MSGINTTNITFHIDIFYCKWLVWFLICSFDGFLWWHSHFSWTAKRSVQIVSLELSHDL